MAHYKGVPNDQELEDSLHLARCAVNAETMQWNKHYIKPQNLKLFILLVAASVAWKPQECLNFAVTNRLSTKSDVLGGTFIPASAESYKGKLRDLLEWYEDRWKFLT